MLQVARVHILPGGGPRVTRCTPSNADAADSVVMVPAGGPVRCVQRWTRTTLVWWGLLVLALTIATLASPASMRAVHGFVLASSIASIAGHICSPTRSKLALALRVLGVGLALVGLVLFVSTL